MPPSSFSTNVSLYLETACTKHNYIHFHQTKPNMSGIMDKIGGAVDNKLNQQAQPGDGVERTADNDANQGLFRFLSNLLSLPSKY